LSGLLKLQIMILLKGYRSREFNNLATESVENFYKAALLISSMRI